MSETNDITTTILDLINQFMTMAEERAKTLPYRINLIETLGGAYETENSKILAAVLRYKSPAGRFEILESLINYIQSRFNAFHEIEKVEQPKIDIEHCHIDVYVREPRKYAIIMENKSNWAGDQDHQLSRYIKTAISEDFAENQIYVLYFPPLEEKDPKVQSWGEYKESFKDRYLKLSWRDVILPWMREKVIPNVRKKDVPLSSALEQYTDYWDGRFGLRGINSEVKMKMRETVIEGLDLGSENDNGCVLKKVRDALGHARKVTDTLAEIEREKKCELEFAFWNDLIAALKGKSNDYELVSKNLNKDKIKLNYTYSDTDWKQGSYAGFNLFFMINGRRFCFNCQTADAGYFGFCFMDESDNGTVSKKNPAQRNEYSKRAMKAAEKALAPNKVRINEQWYGLATNNDLYFRCNDFHQFSAEKECVTQAHFWADRFDGYIKKFGDLMKETQP